MRFLGGLVALSCAIGGSAAAAEEDDPKARASQLVKAGNEFYAKKEYAAALGLFERAFAVYPSPLIHYNLGRTHQLLGNLIPAAAHYQKFLSDSGAGATKERRDLALRGLEEIDRKVGKLALRGVHPGVSIEVDGEPAAGDLETGVRVLPGDHAIKATLERHAPFRTVVTVGAGETTTVEIAPILAIESEPVSRVPRLPEPKIAEVVSAPEEETPVAGTWWFWTLVGAAAVAAGAGIAVALRGGHGGRMGALDNSSTRSWESF